MTPAKVLLRTIFDAVNGMRYESSHDCPLIIYAGRHQIKLLKAEFEGVKNRIIYIGLGEVRLHADGDLNVFGLPVMPVDKDVHLNVALSCWPNPQKGE